MRYKLSHETHYQYPDKVDVSHSILHLRLRGSEQQTVVRQTLDVDPPAQNRNRFNDFFGNPTDYLMIDQPHTRLTIRATCEVTVREPAPVDDGAGTAWDQVQATMAGRTDDPALLAFHMLPATATTRADADMLDWAEPLFAPGRPVVEAAEALSTAIYEGFTYRSGATDVMTPVRDAFAHRHGVCQDFAQVALAILRAKGVPARYVSGYIRTYPPPGKPRLVGADASHAWFGVFDPALGWVDFDPTNNTRLGLDHVTLAWGRDYGDVAPVSGVILGGGTAGLSVSVDLAPLDEPAATPAPTPVA